MIPAFENVAGNCPSGADLRSRYPTFDTPTLPASGPWDGGRGHESLEQAISRSQTMAKWLTSDDLQSRVGDGMLVLVSHADFIALLLAALQVPARDEDNASCQTAEARWSCPTARGSSTERGGSRGAQGPDVFPHVLQQCIVLRAGFMYRRWRCHLSSKSPPGDEPASQVGARLHRVVALF